MAAFVVALAASSPSAAQGLVKVHVFGATESVADFQKSVTNKFSKTMVLVPTRDDADLAIEIEGRDTRAFGKRSVALAVHHRGGTEKLLRFPTGVGGGFRMTAGLAAIADETMKVIDDWLRDHRDALTGKADPKDLSMPLRIFVIADNIKYGDAVAKANAAVDLGLETDHVAAAAPLLAALLAEWEEVAPLENRYARERVGAIAAGALVKLGATDELIGAVSSAKSDVARAHAASVMHQIGDSKLLDALALAVQKDSSTRVRRAAATSLGSWPNRQAVDALIGALGDRDQNVRKDAAAALQKLTQQSFGEDGARWRAWWATAKGGAG
jgi:hypothetical protein